MNSGSSIRYAVVSGEVQIASLVWQAQDHRSFLETFRAFTLDADISLENWQWIELAVELFSAHYAVVELGEEDLTFVRLHL